MQSQNCNSGFLKRTRLISLKQNAIRRGVWFRALPRIDRAIVELTIKIGSEIKSQTLAKSIMSVTRKLEQLLENGNTGAITQIGFHLARKLGLIAETWGYKGALKWGSNVDFVRYLAIIKLNGG